MKALDLATYIRYKTRTNTTTFSNADMLPLVQFRQDELARKLMNMLHEDEDMFLKAHTGDLLVGIRIYPQPSDILSRVKRVEAKLDGTNWLKITPIDITEYSKTHDEATIIENFSNEQGGARYDIREKALYIYSGAVTSVTGGLKLWCFNYPALITDLTENTRDLETDPSTTTFGFPRELHELLARGVIIDYKESREKPIPLTEREQKYDFDVAMAIQVLRHEDQNKEIIARIPPASDRGNSGADY